MPAGDLLLVSVVTGLLLIGAGAVVARIRRRTASLRPSDRVPAAPTGVRVDHLAVGAALLLVLVGLAAVLDTTTMVVAALAIPILTYFAWGVYSLARFRGLPRAHAIGLSAWLFGVVLVVVIAVKLLLD